MTAGRTVATRIVVVLLLACGVAVHAQEPSGSSTDREATRAGEAEARRRAKADELDPYKPPAAEAALLYIEDTRLVGRLFNPVAGWFGQVGGLTEGAGLAGGGGYRISAARAGAIDLRGLVSWNGAFLAGAAWRSDPSAVDRVSVRAHAAIERHAGQRFYGLGPHSTQRFDSDFALDERGAGIDVDIRPAWWIAAIVGGGFSRIALHEMEFDFDDDDDALEAELSGNDPQVQQYMTGAIPGLDTRPDLASVRASVVVDTRRSYGPGGGSRLAVSHARHRDTSGSLHSFSETQIELQHFIPVWSGTRTFALSATGDRVAPASGHGVPFYLQPSLGGSRRLRGFERQRFRDTSVLVLQAEYRYDVNSFVTGALFAEAGQVAPDWTHLRARAFRGDYGVGLRVGYGRTVALRTDVAFGGEGPRFIFGLSGVF